jgi:para-nitrobenzyl esterase
MMDFWLAFIRVGDPSGAGEDQRWPAYDSETRPTMVFDLKTSLQHAPYGEESALWVELNPRPLH